LSSATDPSRCSEVARVDRYRYVRNSEPEQTSGADAGAAFERFAGTYWSDSLATWRRFALRDGRFVVVFRDGRTQELKALDDHSVRFGETHRYVFTDDGTFTDQRDGDPVDDIGLPNPRFRRMPPADATPETYAGTFCSGELGTRWTFVVRNGELVLLRDRHADEPLMQIFRGTFRENDAFLFFHKNGFTARNTTLRSVDFQRCR
jgi:hypothetical protein